MKDDIYTMLNEADINIDDYKKEDFNDIEKKNIKANFKKSISKKKSHKRSMVVAGVVIALTVILFGTNTGVEALTRVLKIAGIQEIGSFMGIQKNLDDYKTVINKAISNNGVTVQLNEVILDGQELTVSYNVTYDKKLSEVYDEKLSKVDKGWHGFNCISINGKELNTGNGGGSRSIDDYTIQTVLTYNLGKQDLSGDLDIKLSCSPVGENEDINKKDENWGFEFNTNGDQLKVDTKEIALDNKFTLENGTEYTLQKYTDNSLGQKMYASISNFQMESTYDVSLKGTDDLGNEVEFYISHGWKEGALFKIENIHGNLNENAKTLTLTPYAAKYPEKSGRMDGEYKKTGDEFTIDLSQLK
ncbi:DUF4179 domain-containing protein [Clostridium uliginosum]|uniref:DUF4179 domain-containing protein n=1 Tax=Clostridium uliginosum TaxID=119641 RepID=A0A1I1S8E1_9CLOT|nr:DUF4179 domain-containing protein [Clostridium uliginosum]SFD42667.1 protein of unknown function [Clostridium uliginosum]